MSSRRDTIRRIVDALTGLYVRTEAEAIARALITDKENITMSHLLAFADEECRIGNNELQKFTAELAAGRPLQFVLGHCEFCGLTFEVGEGVLIPRPETEELVAAVLERTSEGASLLDLCTGSGCIAISLAKRLKSSSVTAVDISEKALEYARRNAAKNGAEVEFIQADILQPSDCSAIRRGVGETDPMFDVIVSNPPYVPQSDIASMHKNVVAFEPHEALFVPDDNPLLFYQRIAVIGRQMLRDGGLLAFEIYESYSVRVAEMLAEAGYRDIEILDDANLKPRIVCCRK